MAIKAMGSTGGIYLNLPRKDDGLSQPHLVLIQQQTGLKLRNPGIPSQPPDPPSQHQAYNKNNYYYYDLINGYN